MRNKTIEILNNSHLSHPRASKKNSVFRGITDKTEIYFCISLAVSILFRTFAANIAIAYNINHNSDNNR